jgi:hypothetical protein
MMPTRHNLLLVEGTSTYILNENSRERARVSALVDGIYLIARGPFQRLSPEDRAKVTTLNPEPRVLSTGIENVEDVIQYIRASDRLDYIRGKQRALSEEETQIRQQFL